MIILGLDPSQSSGWALYDTELSISAMRCGVLKAEGSKGTPLAEKAASLGPKLVKLIKETRPDFVAIESPPQKPYGRPDTQKPKFMGEELPADSDDDDDSQANGKVTGLKGVISTNDCATALATVIRCYGIPFILLQDSTWRSAAYGFGRRQGWSRPDWKKHARQKCAQVRITVTNDDMAEACWIAFAGASSQTFKMLQSRRAA